MRVIDATDMVLGRLASHVAKEALLGEEMHVVNAEKAVITGRKKEILAKYKQRRERGAPLKGPYFPRTPERIVKRAIRGMLPYKQSRGREALSRVKCHAGIPESLKDKKIEKIDLFDVNNKNVRYITISEISAQLGARTA